MIVTCAACLTKYNLDDSKIKPKGVKVRCSRCKNVFWVVPPRKTKEEIIEKFEEFAKFHEEMMETPKTEPTIAKEEIVKEEEIPTPEEKFLFEERPRMEEKEEIAWITPQVKEEIPKPKKIIEKERRIFPAILSGIIIVVIILLAYIYFTGDIGSVKKITGYIDKPIEKITDLWNRILGTEKEGLLIGNLNGYDEKVGDLSIFIIEGRINNQSRFTKKHIKLKVSIYDKNKTKVAEKEVFCGKILTREELKHLSPDFIKGDMVIQFKTDQEKIISRGKEAPFMVIFKDIPPNATEFSVEIVEAPNL